MRGVRPAAVWPLARCMRALRCAVLCCAVERLLDVLASLACPMDRRVLVHRQAVLGTTRPIPKLRPAAGQLAYWTQQRWLAAECGCLVQTCAQSLAVHAAARSCSGIQQNLLLSCSRSRQARRDTRIRLADSVDSGALCNGRTVLCRARLASDHPAAYTNQRERYPTSESSVRPRVHRMDSAERHRSCMHARRRWHRFSSAAG